MVSKPNIVLPTWAISTTIIQEPSETKKEQGWQVSEKPPAHWMNWILNSICQYLSYCVSKLDEIDINGIKDPTPVGIIQAYAGSSAPSDWLICSGSLVNIADYPKLYIVIGTAYGGDGITTFRLPDAQGRVLVGAGSGSGLTSRNLNDKGGEENHQLVINEIAAHNHTAELTHTHDVIDTGHLHDTVDPGHQHNYSEPTAKAPQSGNCTWCYYADPSSQTTSSAKTGITIANSKTGITIGNAVGNMQTDNAGGNQSHNNMQPYIVINYIIKAN